MYGILTFLVSAGRTVHFYGWRDAQRLEVGNRARLLEVELQAVVSQLMCELGTELGFSA